MTGRVGSWVGVVALSLIFGAAFCWPLLDSVGHIGPRNDWDQHLTLHWVPYETVRQYGQIPLWNPYVCGGMPMLGNPQSRWLTPFFLLHVWFGPELALQLEMLAHICLGWLGAFVLGRTVGLSRVASLAPATIFAGSSYLYLHLAEGHSTWMAYAYMPSILAAALAKRPIVAGIGLAVAVYEGGIYTVVHTVLALALLALHRSIADKSLRPIAGLGVTAIMAICVAAPKLMMMQPLLAQYPRLTESTETVSVELVARALVDREQNLEMRIPDEHALGFYEYGAYVGPVPVLLALFGAVASMRRTIPWLLLLCAGLALSLGRTPGGEYSPWSLLHEVPIFASLRIPSRFIVLAVLALGVLAGFGTDRLVTTRRYRRMAMAVALLAIAAIDMGLVASPLLRHVGDAETITLDRSERFVQLNNAERKQMYPAAQANMGSLDCYEPLEPAVAPAGMGDAHYRGEQYLLRGGSVTLVEWSPNRLTLAVSSNAPDILVVNYNYDSFWQVVSGAGQPFNQGGLLGVAVPAGTQQLVLAYRSQRFTVGVALAIAALAGAALWRLKR
jgi:hypothetical protein